MKSVNVFKNHLSNKITISNEGMPKGEFEIMWSGPKVIFSVNGTGKYGMQDMLFVVLNISKKFVIGLVHYLVRFVDSSKFRRTAWRIVIVNEW